VPVEVVMQCIYLVVGEEKPGQERTFVHRPVRSGTHRVNWLYVPTGYKISSTVGQIAAHIAEKGDKIDKLQLLGHGDAGTMYVGEDMTEENVWAFGWLRDKFVDMAFGIQLLGCGVASDRSIYGPNRTPRLGVFDPKANGQGYRLMLALAKATQQSVEAGIHMQVNDALYDIEGDAVRVYPDGTSERFTGASKT
jgi:hypothetical protein